METSPNDYDQEIAENIQNRLFYESSTHDLVVNLLRNYKHQGRGYLDGVTELSHVFIRMLERYSKQNADMQIRSKRRSKKTKEKTGQQDDDESDREVENHKIQSTERKFDFARFAGRFLNQGCIDTFIAFTRLYQDLDEEQLKRAHRFFHRAAFKADLSSLLFRVDIIQLFHNMIKGEQALDKNISCFKDWEELVRQLFKRLVKRVQERPELVVEMLFSKIPNTLFYLEHGYDKEVTKSAPRPPAQLEVHPDINPGDRIGLVTEVLLSKGDMVLIQWIKDQLRRAVNELETWKQAEEARKQSAGYEPQADSEQPTESDSRPPVICK
jgi:replication fork protection complex subunit Tof1/Swi1